MIFTYFAYADDCIKCVVTGEIWDSQFQLWCFSVSCSITVLNWL